MNFLDILICLVLAFAFFDGWRKGLIGKAFGFVGLICGVWLALLYGARCGEALHLEGRTAAATGFLIVLAAVLVVASLAGRLAGRLCSSLGLGGLNVLLGIALSLAEAVLLLGVAFRAADYLWPALIAPQTRAESRCYGPVVRAADLIFPALVEYAGSGAAQDRTSAAQDAASDEKTHDV